MPIRFDHPALLWLLLLAIPIVWLAMRNLAAVEAIRRWTAIGIRLAVLVVVVLMLAGLQTVQTHSDLTVIAVVDQSRSVRTFAKPPIKSETGSDEGKPGPADSSHGDGKANANTDTNRSSTTQSEDHPLAEPATENGSDHAGQSGQAVNSPESQSVSQWVRRYIRRAGNDEREDDKFGWVTFDGRSTVRSLPRIGMDMDQGTVESPTQGTNATEAIRTALALYPADSGARMLLVSDGNDTGSKQQLLQAAREAAAAGIPIDVLPINYRVKNEVMVEGVYAPTQARKGQTVAVRVVMRGTHPAAGRLQLKAHDELIDLNGPSSSGTGMPVTPEDWTINAESKSGGKPSDEKPMGTADSDGSKSQNGNPNTKFKSQISNSQVSDSNRVKSGPGSVGRYVLAKQIDLPMKQSGASEFEAIFEPDAGSGPLLTGAGSTNGESSGSNANANANAKVNTDTNAARADAVSVNNKARTFTLVKGKGKVLFIDNVGGESGHILPEMLANHGINVDVARPEAIPSSLRRMQQYDAVVFQNVSADLVTGSQQKAVEHFVHDLGGGFVMIGGPDSFGAGAWTNTEIDKRILPVSCQIPSQTVLPSGALLIVLDRSGSMGAPVSGSNKTKQELANEASVLALSTLYPQDIRGVVAFDGNAKWIEKTGFNKDPAQTARKVRSIHPGGGTNIYAGLKEAYDSLATLRTQDAAVKHIILLTDGQSMAPPGGGGYVKLASQMAAHDITLSTVGVGDARNSSLLNQLASQGGGRYHPIKNPNNLPQVFIKEAKVVRKNLVKEETFEPRMTNTGSPIVKGLGSPPKLKGFVLTGQKHDPRVFEPIKGPEGEPIFAHWQVGLGRSAAFTSDATNRWAANWLAWGGYADFWTRLVRDVARPSESRNVDLQTDIVGNQLKVRLDAASYGEGQTGQTRSSAEGDQGGFTNFLKVKGAVLKPDGSTEPITLEQTGPGVYQTTMPAHASGNYIVNLFMDKNASHAGSSVNGQAQGQGQGKRERVVGGASKPPGAELRKFESNLPILREIARRTGGRMLDPRNPQPASLYARGNTVFKSQSIRPLWRTLLIWLLVLFLLDVANRRIAWDPHAIAAWVRRVAGSLVLPNASSREEADQTLESLRKRRAATQAVHARGQAPTAQAGAGSSAHAAAPERTRKFDAPEDARANPDFAEAVGGAREDGTSRTLVTAAMQKSRSAETGHAEDTGPTTGRLRQAKTRARQRLAEQKD